MAGFGGRTTDNERETETALRYPGWEVTYRLGFLGQLEQNLLLVFHNPTAETGDLDLVGGERMGSQTVNELIGTWRPKFAVVAGENQGREMYGSSVVVSPGRFDQGQYAVFDTHRGGDVHLRTSAAATPRG